MQFRLCVYLFLASTACSASPGDPPPTNGVNDVLQACRIRASWKSASATACNTCIGLATSPRCACTDADYAGKCSEQQSAKTKEPSCEGTDTCVNTCDRSDCACVDRCYASKPACRTPAAAVDGCVAEVCDSFCR